MRVEVPSVDVGRLLTTPRPEQPIPDLADEILSLSDYVSPSHWMLTAFDAMFGFNPAEKAADWVAGDWEGLARTQDALRKLSDFQEEISKNITNSVDEMTHEWLGSASDAAAGYFGRVANAVREHGAALDRLSSTYHQTAYGVWALAKGIVSLLEILADYLIDLGISLAATAVASESGAGLVIGGAADAYLAYKANSIWFKIVDYHGKIMAAANGFAGTVASELSMLRGVTETSLPAGAYDNRVVI